MFRVADYDVGFSGKPPKKLNIRVALCPVVDVESGKS